MKFATIMENKIFKTPAHDAKISNVQQKAIVQNFRLRTAEHSL